MRILLLLSALMVSGCATIKMAPERGPAEVNTKTIMPVPKNRAGDVTSGVAFAYEFQGSSLPEDGKCRMRFINKDSGKSFFVNLKKSETVAFAGLTPGKYGAGRLGCGLTRVYDMDDLYPQGFEVAEGTAGYLGKVVFKFEGKDLSQVSKAARPDSARAFEEVKAIVPPGVTLVSAFTQTELTSAMADAGTTSRGFNVSAKGIEGDKLGGLLGDLQRCEKDIMKDDPLRFGTLDYIATYKAGKFSEFKERNDTNAFPETLRECVSKTLSAFKPEAKSSIEIRVVY